MSALLLSLAGILESLCDTILAESCTRRPSHVVSLVQSLMGFCSYRIMKNVNVKTSVMNLLSHESAEVRKEALLALQKLMVSNWEYLNQS